MMKTETMKTLSLAIGLTLLASCSQPVSPSATGSKPVAASPATPRLASARGVVQSIDLASQTVTIAHGAVPALDWPAMTMTFHAPAPGLDAIAKGDDVDFEFTADGMDATITRIDRHSGG